MNDGKDCVARKVDAGCDELVGMAGVRLFGERVTESWRLQITYKMRCEHFMTIC